MRYVYEYLIEKPEGKRPFGKPAADGLIKLKWIIRKV
jgi:hypothetical protein